MWISVGLGISDVYFCYLIVLVNPVFNCSKSLLSSSVDKVTAGTYNFVSVISNVVPVGAPISGTGDQH